MPVYFPNTDTPSLRAALAQPGSLLVACLCAEWCVACREYQPKFTALAERFAGHAFVWIDIETFPELLDDHDVENFPTLLIQSADHTLFYGPMLPHIGHLERLLESLQAEPGSPIASAAPDVREALAE
jgi:thiol-disulfide isomerase/thioredoxin